MKSKIMYFERKAGRLIGEARIGRVTYSKSGRTLYYQGKAFQSLDGTGFKANYYEIETSEEYWISGPKKRGPDRLYGERLPVEIDEDVREEYWTQIRGRSDLKTQPLAWPLKRAMKMRADSTLNARESRADQHALASVSESERTAGDQS